MVLFETARTDMKVVHKEGDRQRLKQLDVALQTMATQATRKLRLAVEKLGKALAWFKRGATAGKLTTNAQLDSALKEKKKSEKQEIELLKAQIKIRVHGYGWTPFDTAWSSSTDRNVNNGCGPGALEAVVCRREGRDAPPAVEAAGPQRGDEAPQNFRNADDSSELLDREAQGKCGGDVGGGCSACREGGCG